MSPIPPPCPPGIGAASFFSGSSEIRASVVSISEAIDPAFCNAVRTTFAGSSTPAWPEKNSVLAGANKAGDRLIDFWLYTLSERPAQNATMRSRQGCQHNLQILLHSTRQD